MDRFGARPVDAARPGRVRSLISLLAVAAGIAVACVPAPALFGVAAADALVSWWETMPRSLTQDVPERSVLLDANGKRFATFYEQDRVVVAPEDISSTMKKMIVATEDKRFYEHNGVDVKGLVRAAVASAAGGGVQGGSGITQQYVKNLLVARAADAEQAASATAQTVTRKIAEVMAALSLERNLSKEEILTGYLNTVYFGDGAYGVESAAKRFFGSHASELTVSQSALLAGLVNSPGALNPFTNPAGAKQRRNQVLQAAAANNVITAAQLTRLRKTPLRLTRTPTPNGCGESRYPFYCAMVRQRISSDPAFGPSEQARAELLRRGGLTVRTALEPKVQNAVDRVAAKAMDRFAGPAVGIAVVQPGTGRVAAVGTNRGYGTRRGETELVYATSVGFQSGSTFKPFTAAAAIEAGVEPTRTFYAGSNYTPPGRSSPPGGFRNNEGADGGTYDMAGALRHSVNTWFVKLEDQVGVREVAKTAHAMGMVNLPLAGERGITENDASLTLGTFAASPLEVANSYATIAAHGNACPASPILSARSPSGELASPPACRQAVRPSTADTVAHMLEGVIYRKSDPGRTGRAAAFGRPAGGKTGTADSTSSVWFAGFTPQYATAVWIGDPRGGFAHPLETIRVFGQTYSPVYGGGGPAAIWREVMSGIHRGLPVEDLPRGGGDAYVNVVKIMPDVRGLDPAQAVAVLARAGIRGYVEEAAAVDGGGVPEGRVAATTPKPGDAFGPAVRQPAAKLVLAR